MLGSVGWGLRPSVCPPRTCAPFPKSRHGNQWILVLSDHFTHWAEALPIPDAITPTVARALDEHIFCRFGVPERIHSDQGVQFEAAVFQELCNIWGTQHSRTTPYHPQGNGVVERNNRMLGDALRTLLAHRQQDDWDAVLPQIMRAYRGTPHSTTQETPNALMFGRQLLLPDQLRYGRLDEDLLPAEEYAAEVQRRLEEAYEALRQTPWSAVSPEKEEPLLFCQGD